MFEKLEKMSVQSGSSTNVSVRTMSVINGGTTSVGGGAGGSKDYSSNMLKGGGSSKQNLGY